MFISAVRGSAEHVSQVHTCHFDEEFIYFPNMTTRKFRGRNAQCDSVFLNLTCVHHSNRSFSNITANGSSHHRRLKQPGAQRKGGRSPVYCTRSLSGRSKRRPACMAAQIQGQCIRQFKATRKLGFGFWLLA